MVFVFHITYIFTKLVKHTSVCLGNETQQDFESLKETVSNQEKELETLRSECDLLSSELQLRKELTSDLEVQIHNLEQKAQASEEAALAATHQLSAALEAKKSLSDEVGGRNGVSVTAVMKLSFHVF